MNKEPLEKVDTSALTTNYTSSGKNKIQLLIISAGLSTILVSSPGMAGILDGIDLSGILNKINLPNLYDKVVGEITDHIPVIGGILKQELGNLKCSIFGCKSKDGGGGDDATIDEEDIPNPYEIRADATSKQESDPTGDVLSINATVRGRDLSNLYDQELSRATAAPYLGKTGITWAKNQAKTTKTVLDSNSKIADAITTLATAAQKKDVTQDVMKNQTAVQSQIAGLLINQAQIGVQEVSTLNSLLQGQAALLQLGANSSEALDEANRRERVNRNSVLFQAAGMQVYVRGLY